MLQRSAEMLRLELPCTRAAASAVREAMSKLEDVGWVLGDAMLVATELVNNAVTHSGCDETHTIQVEVHRESAGIVISVRDPGSTGRVEAALSHTIELGGGLGLMIVGTLSRRWGSDHDHGYRVWAELAVEPPA